MRKLLLATVAALGASMAVATYADAQIVDNTDGDAFPTPGTVTIRLNGRFRFYAYATNDGAQRSITSTTGAAAGGSLNAGINKLSNYGFENYARLYPGFDGVAANGLKYGASLEIRQDNTFGAGGGADGSVTGDTRTRGILYFRRTWGYLGTDKFGTLRLGSSDQPSSLYATGLFENFNDGGLNGDLPGLMPNGGLINWPFNDVGNIYSTTKAVYLSPQFYGVDFGLSYEPSTGGIGNDNGTGCTGSGQFGNALIATGSSGGASIGCDALSSTSTGDYTRRKNMFEGLIRYRGTFGPIGIAATAQYDGSGRVLDSGIAGSATNPKRKKLEDLSYGDFGLQLTYGGLSFGGNFQTGRYNVLSGSGAGGLLAQGQNNSSAVIVGASYTIGPVIFGAHALANWYQGAQTQATNQNANGVSVLGAPGTVIGGQRRDVGFAAGATYSLAPGVSIFVSYLYEQAKQHGLNLVNGTSNIGTTNGDAHFKLDQSVLAIGTAFAW